MDGNESALHIPTHEDPERQPPPTIFLSHSGEEKAFVEQLCEDLKSMNHFPFFDQDSDVLPKGEEFPPRILHAAKACKVAVVVLSKGYLTSKWPMLELTASVESMRINGVKLLPLFFKLNPEDISEELVENCWKRHWEKLVKNQQELESWEKAVKVLRGQNGLVFQNCKPSEFTYRTEVVKEICKLLPSAPKYDVSHIQGYERLCKATSLLFKSDQQGRHYLGLYGTGGLGKTTICEAMCNYFEADFSGRVCLLQLGNDKPEDRVERLRHAIHQLAGLHKDFNMSQITSESQGHVLLKQRLRLQPSVFLVVDNVTDCIVSREEATFYVNVVFAQGSKVLVAARSQDILKWVLEESCCQPIQGLEMDEASQLFLSMATPPKLKRIELTSLEPNERQSLQACVCKCSFDKQYHPLALRALGIYLRDNTDCEIDNISNWADNLGDQHIFQDSPGSTEAMFKILGLGYNTLQWTSKQIFLDLAFFGSTMSSSMDMYANIQWDERSDFTKVVSFIARLHEIPTRSAHMKVQGLQRRGLLNESKTKIIMHDLYKEFAQWSIKEGHEAMDWYKICGGEFSEHHISMPNMFSQNLLRVYLKSISLVGGHAKKIHEWKNVVFLYMWGLRNLRSLNLQGLESLRVIIVKDCEDLEEIVCRCTSPHNDAPCYEEGGCMTQLQIVQLVNLDILKNAHFISHCWNLQTLWFHECWSLDRPPNLSNCSKLESLRLPCGEFDVVEGLFKNQALREFNLYGLKLKERLLNDLMQLTRLVILDLEDHSYKAQLDWVPIGGCLDVSKLVLLSFLNLSFAVTIREIEGLDRLTQLTALGLYGCSELQQLQDHTNLPNLQWLCIYHCNKLPHVNVPRGVKGFHNNAKGLHDDHDCLSQDNCEEYLEEVEEVEEFEVYPLEEIASSSEFHDLQKEYNKLQKESKIMFLDLAIFSFFSNLLHMKNLDEPSSFEHVIFFIARLYGIPELLANTKVQELKNKGLLNDSYSSISMRDIHKRFAQWLIKEDWEARDWFLICNMDFTSMANVSFPRFLRVSLAGRGGFHLVGRDPKNIRGWQTVVFLELCDLTNLHRLDLQGLECLRVMTVGNCFDLEEILCTCDTFNRGLSCYERKLAWRCMDELQIVLLKDLKGSMKRVPFLSHCGNLQCLLFDSCWGLENPPDLRFCTKLEILRIPSIHTFTTNLRIQFLNHVMDLTKLTNLDLYHDYDWFPTRTCLDVSKLVHLSYLKISLANNIEEIKGLEQLPRLVSLALYCSHELCRLPNIFKFKELQWICISHCPKLTSLAMSTWVKVFHNIECHDHKCLSNNNWGNCSRVNLVSKFSNLQHEYNKLEEDTRLIFLDLAFFDCFTKVLRKITHEFEQMISFLARLHGIPELSAKAKVQKLQTMGFINVSNIKISISDLHQDFAKWLIMEDGEAKDWFLICNTDSSINTSNVSFPRCLRVRLAKSWKGLSLVNFDPISICGWQCVVILELLDLKNLITLNLQGLECLRVLTVEDCVYLEEIICTCDTFYNGLLCYENNPTWGCMHELHIVVLKDLKGSLKRVPFLMHCEELQTLLFDSCWGLDSPPDLRFCSKLERLRVPGIHNFTTNLTSTLLNNVMKLTNLTTLDLDQEHDWIPRMSLDIGKLVHLSYLNISHSNNIQSIEGLGRLSQLVALGLYCCHEMWMLPDLLNFKNLEWLCISHCPKLWSLVVPARVKAFHKYHGNDHEVLVHMVLVSSPKA